MASVTTHFLDVWRSGNHVGINRPTIVVEIRGGNWRRDYRPWASPINATIPGEEPDMPWYPIFTELTPWVEIPNILQCRLEDDFEQNGMTVATVSVNNIGFEPVVGPFADLYHAISRGYLSAERGYDPPGRTPSGLAVNGWSDVITEQRQIRIWQGYGQPERVGADMPEDGGSNGAWVFMGLIDDVDTSASPVAMTIVARQGKVLTDSRIFGWNKSRHLKDPVVFSDRLAADDLQLVGQDAEASSELSAEFLAANVVDDDGTSATYWESIVHTTAGNTEWIEIHVPAGRYEDIVLNCDAGLDVYVGVYLRNQAPGVQATWDGVNKGEGFVSAGLGSVPGANGGWPYVARVPSASAGTNVISLGHVAITGNDGTLRVGFRNLQGTAPSFTAQVRTLKGRRRRISTVAITQDWILVDDLSDMVKVALRWAGYTEWEVEDTGVRLTGKMLFNRASYLIDIVKRAVELTGFVFFVADPPDGSSEGIPVFRRNSALQAASLVLTEVRDTDLITDLSHKRTEEPLPYIIRWRGKTARTGTTLGGDSSVRIMAVYRPPWTEDNSSAGIIMHVTHTENSLQTLVECEIACYLTAINGALKASTASFEIPGNPAIELDDQIGLVDTATGLNTRLWVANRSSTFQGGEQTSWTMALQGSLIDTADLIAIIAEIDGTDFTPQPSPITPTSRSNEGRFR